MDTVFQQIEEWLKNMMVPAVMDKISTIFNSINSEVGNIASEVGTTPNDFSPGIFNMIRNISDTVIMPVAGIILTFIACYELIQLVISYNNLANFETWFIWKWIFKTAIAVELITHTFDFTMAVFDVAQHIIVNAGGVIQGDTSVSADALAQMQSTVEAMSIFGIFGLYLQINIVDILMWILSKLVFVIIYCRMIEIYMYVSLAPIPFATFGNKEQSMIGQNYMRSLFALGFQGFLIMICVGIYAMLVQGLAFSSDIIASIWGMVGYTLLLAFSIFKTGGIARSILQAH
ncbi:VirB6/TrbL-like conjugal transfer protein, CD1112 family [Butyrivibrio sp.]|uniref:VirB6/TrbL-like conjugal transfer protein, CD1112 family n=1 Tax=Butyrivibrio sp. TaxID=28121 RepID=UPI0025C01B89|nr:CD0415/CD1112 family protein [Butyrivibrio sp.]MBQ9304972.1 hypothetical protein [Butyrivibrio sp.]